MRCTAFSPSERPDSNDAFVTGSFWKSSIVNFLFSEPKSGLSALGRRWERWLNSAARLFRPCTAVRIFGCIRRAVHRHAEALAGAPAS
jgi:hypothetical protein